MIRQSKGQSIQILAAVSSFKYSQTRRVALGQIKTLLNVVFNSTAALDLEPKELFNVKK
jgi:hypothetical protein